VNPVRWFFDEHIPVDAWRAYITWNDECERGLVHTAEYDDRMKELGKRLAAVINDARLVNKIDAGRAELELRS